jgi:hypothetical protein
MKFFRKNDIIVLAIIVIVGILSWAAYSYFFSNKAAKAEIYYKTTLIETIDLNTGVDKTFSIPQNEHVVFHLYKNGAIQFEESNCPDKICIKTGKLSKVGETAACLPNEIFLKIVPANNRSSNDLDGVVGK